MKRWPTIPLGELVLPIEQRDPRERPQEEFSYVDIAGVNNETKEISAAKRMLGADAPSRARKVIRDGDVIVSTVRPNLNAVARVSSALDKQICSTGFAVLRPCERLMSGYLFAFVRSPGFIEHLVARTTGANYPAVNEGKVKEVPIVLPPLAEQERIVKLLDEASELRKLRALTDRSTAALIPALFHDMFGDPISNARRWQSAPLGSFLEFLTSGSRGWAKYYSGSGANFLRIQNVGDNELLLDDLAHVTPPNNAEGSRTRVRSGDVLLSITADLGRTAVIPDKFPTTYISQHLALLRLRKLNPSFVATTLSSASGKSKWQEFNRAAIKSGLNFDDIRSFPMILPPLPLQEEFSRRLIEIRELEVSQTASRFCLEQLSESMLHKAFRGTL